MQYLHSWALNTLETTEKWKKFSLDLCIFIKELDLEKIWDQLKNEYCGHKNYEIKIDANDSVMKFNRHGELLVFDMLHSSLNKAHKSAKKTAERLCRSPDTTNNQGVYEILHHVDIDIPLPTIDLPKHIDVEVDFSLIYDQLRLFAGQIDWTFDTDALIERYKKVDSGYQLIGEYFGIPIYTTLLHQGRQKKAHKKEKLIWRNGNAKKAQTDKYRFFEASDLVLRIHLSSSLPTNSYDIIPKGPDLRKEQFKIATVAATLINQIATLRSHDYLSTRYKQKAI